MLRMQRGLCACHEERALLGAAPNSQTVVRSDDAESAPACMIGLDVGGTKIAGGLVMCDFGEVLCKRVVPTRPERGPQAVLDDLLELARSLLSEARRVAAPVGGIGIGVPETVDPKGNVTSGQTLAWQNIPVQSICSELAPAIVESDVRAAALGEALFGAGRNYGAFAYITVGTGISSCLVLDGRPFPGARGNALVLASAPLSTTCNRCGGRIDDVLEEFAAGPALVQRYNRAAPERVSKAEEVLEAAVGGSRVADRIIESAAAALGNSVGFFVNILDPEAVIVGGGLGLAGDPYWNRFVESTRQHIWAEQTRGLPIRRAQLGGDSGLIGAAAAAIRKANVEPT